MKKHNIYAVRRNAEDFQTCIWHHRPDCRGGESRCLGGSSHYTPLSRAVACTANKPRMLKIGDFWQMTPLPAFLGQPSLGLMNMLSSLPTLQWNACNVLYLQRVHAELGIICLGFEHSFSNLEQVFYTLVFIDFGMTLAQILVDTSSIFNFHTASVIFTIGFKKKVQQCL